jgi:hypothetical protein
MKMGKPSFGLPPSPVSKPGGPKAPVAKTVPGKSAPPKAGKGKQASDIGKKTMKGKAKDMPMMMKGK